MKNDNEYYKEMYHTMLQASEIAIRWIRDGRDPMWAAHILMQAEMDCENIYVNEEIPTAEKKQLYRMMYQDVLHK